MTKKRMCAVAAILGSFLVLRTTAQQAGGEAPQFTAAGQLVRPADYREWIWLSSGIGMAYGPNAGSASEDPPFDNVFVNRPAYASFLKNGVWPEGTTLVLEIRRSASKESINRGGHFQAGLRAIEVEVKRGGKWSFYGFEGGAAAGTRMPDSASCYTCHGANGAVDNTFVQFYPTLIDVARAKGTFKASTTER